MNSKISWLRRAAFFGCASLAPVAFAQVSPLGKEYHMVSWAAPMANIDGSIQTDLAGYRVYHGTSPNALTAQYYNPANQRWIYLSYPAGGTHYFAVSAVNKAGVESSRTPVIATK